MPPTRIAILGIGQMGLVCAGVLAGKPGFDLVMWGHSIDESGDLTQTRSSPRLKGFTLPDSVRVTHDLKKAVADADVVVSSVPVQFIRDVWTQIRVTKTLPARTGAVSVAAGTRLSGVGEGAVSTGLRTVPPCPVWPTRRTDSEVSASSSGWGP